MDDQDAEKNAVVAASAGRQALQKILNITVKAGLSSIPWAALVFDVGQAAVDFGNARLTDRLLENLGERTSRLEGEVRDRLNADGVYEMSAHAAIRRLLTETNPRMADALANAVAGLGASDAPRSEKMEAAQALDILNEPTLHLLQTYYRFHRDTLTAEEKAKFGSATSGGGRFGNLLVETMTLLQWGVPMNALQAAGLIEGGVDGGSWDDANYFPPWKVTLLGIQILSLCFDDPDMPMFGAFAVPDADT